MAGRSGSTKASEDDVKRYFDLIDTKGYSSKQAAEKLGFSKSWAYDLNSKRRLEKVVLITTEPPEPLVWDQLDGGVKDTLKDFNLFCEVFLARDSVPWRRDAANRIVEMLDSQMKADDPERLNVVINTPPGIGKTTLFSHDIPAWLICGGGWLDPEVGRAMRIMLGHQSVVVSTDYVRRLRNFFGLRNPFQEYDKTKRQWREAALVPAMAFGRFKPKTTAGEESIWRKESFLVAQAGGKEVYQKEPTVQAAGYRTEFIGNRVNLAVWDDLDDERSASSIEQSEQKSSWREGQAETRVEPAGLFCIVQQRISTLDQSEAALEAVWTDDAGESHKLYDHIVYPAHNDATCDNDHRQWDPSEDDGCLLDAKRLPWRDILKAQSKENWLCTPAETPILMADWTDKPISEIEVGEWVMGFEVREDVDGKKRTYRKPTQVQGVTKTNRPVANITMRSGHVMRSTPDHPWFGGSRLKWKYLPAKPGRKFTVYWPPAPIRDEDREDWAYLAGIMDGEGYIPQRDSKSNCVTVCQSKSKNPEVFAHIQAVLDRLGVDYHLYEPANGHSGYIFQIRGARSFLRRLLQVPQFGKAHQARAWLDKGGRSMFGSTDSVYSVNVGRAEPVYGLATTTENYFAWGVPCHNTLYQQESADPSKVLVHPAWLDGEIDPTGYPAPGCYDRDRGFFEWPPDTNLVDYVVVDPSVANYWAIEWWAVNPETRVRHLIWGARKKMNPGTETGFLDWDDVKHCHVGIMEELQQKSGLLGHPIRIWVVEQNAAHKYLFRTNAYKLWRQKWPLVSVIEHQTQKNKADPDFGVEALLPMVYKTGMARLPAKHGDLDARNYMRAKRDELTKYPFSRTDDTVMANWFGEYNLERIIQEGRRFGGWSQPPAQKNMPRYLQNKIQVIPTP